MNGGSNGLSKYGLPLAIGATAAILSASAGLAMAQKATCKYHDFQAVQKWAEEITPTPEGCAIAFRIPLKGTLNGSMISCFPTTGSEGFIGVGGDNIWWNFAKDTLVTKDGTLYAREYDTVDYDQGIFTGMVKVTGGTDRFAGATGTLIGALEIIHYDNPQGNWANVRLTGFICSTAP